MSTRAVVYFHHKSEKDSNLNYTMKLYHHWDWYLDWLWLNLNTIFSEWKKEYEDPNNNSWSQRGLFQKIAEEWWFEMTCRYHSDTDYVYHVYFSDVWDIMKSDWKKFSYMIYFQKDWDHEWIRDEPMTLLSDNWILNKKFIS